MDDDAYECPECLKKIPGAEVMIKQRAIDKKEKRKRAAIVIGGAAALVIIITLAVAAVRAVANKTKNEYTKPIDSYIYGCVMNDYSKYISAFPAYYAQYMTEQFAYNVLGQLPEDNENTQKAAILYLDSYYQQLAKTYGNDVKIKYDIAAESQYTPEKLQELQDEYISYNKDQLAGTVFSDAYDLKVTFNISGALDKNTLVKDIMVCKINDKWQLMYYVDFLADDSEQTTDIEKFQ